MPDIDHRLMAPPSLRVQHETPGAGGSTTYVWDFRIAQPNVTNLPMPVVHSIEHFLGTYLRQASDRVVAVAPMGCQTGFYIVTVDVGAFDEIATLISDALHRIGMASSVPLADCTHCGWATNHSLEGAQQVAAWLLDRRREWSQPTHDPTRTGGDPADSEPMYSPAPSSQAKRHQRTAAQVRAPRT